MRSRCASTTSREDTSPLAISCGQLTGAAAPQLLGHRALLLLGCRRRGRYVLKASLIAAAVGARAARRRLRRPRDPHGLRRLARRARRDHRRLPRRPRRAAPDNGQAYGGTGRREINWDGVPASATFPNRLPGGQFASARRGVRHARDRHRGLQRLAVGRRLPGLLGREALLARSAPTAPTCASTCPARRARRSPTRSGSCSPTSTPPAGAAVTFLDARGATLLEVAGAHGPTLSFVGVRFRDGERVAEVQVRSGSVPIAPGVVDTPQTDLAAIDDVIFGEPEADLFAAARPQLVPTDVPPASTSLDAPAVPSVRASLIPLAKRVRAGRTLKLVLGSSADTTRHADASARPSRSLHARGGRDARSSFKVPAKAKTRQAEAQARRVARRAPRRASP